MMPDGPTNGSLAASSCLPGLIPMKTTAGIEGEGGRESLSQMEGTPTEVQPDEWRAHSVQLEWDGNTVRLGSVLIGVLLPLDLAGIYLSF